MKPDEIEDAIKTAELFLKFGERGLIYGDMSEMDFAVQKSIDATMSQPPLHIKVRKDPGGIKWDENLLGIKSGERQVYVGLTAYSHYDENDNEVPVFTIKDEMPVIYDDGKGARIIEKAISGDPSANRALCYIAAAYIEIGCAMPEGLRSFICFKLMKESATESKVRGRSPLPGRNYKIGWAIDMVAAGSKLRPTRNRAFEGASNNLSACFLVKKALERRGEHLSESAVEKIWQDYCRDYPKEVSSANRPK